MDKTISTKLPEEEVETLEKMAGEKGESVSGFVRNLVRMAIEKNGKVDQNPDKNPNQETAKKIDEFGKILIRTSAAWTDHAQKIRDEIGQIPKAGESPAFSPVLLDSLKQNTRELGDLKRKIDHISGAGGDRVSFRNPEFRRKILIGWAFGFLLFWGVGGWGTWQFYQYAREEGKAEGAASANPVSKSFYHLMQCDEPGWKWVWKKGGTELWCYPYSTGKGTYGWRIR
jgi:hypothetical protein